MAIRFPKQSFGCWRGMVIIIMLLILVMAGALHSASLFQSAVSVTVSSSTILPQQAATVTARGGGRGGKIGDESANRATSHQFVLEATEEQEVRLSKKRQPAGAAAVFGRDTRGKFRDEFDTGNDQNHFFPSSGNATFVGSRPPTEKTAITFWYGSQVNQTAIEAWLSEAEGEEGREGKAKKFFVSSSYRVGGRDKSSKRCFYYVKNFCVSRGALVLFAPPAAAHGPVEHKNRFSNSEEIQVPSGKDSSGSFRLCNELKGKVALRYSIQKAPLDTELPHPLVPIPRRHNHTETKTRYQPGQIAACWQYYGFHLFQCLAATFAAQAELKLAHVRTFLYNHAQSLPKASREHYSHAVYLGSPSDWADPNPPRPIRESGFVLPSSYWRLWSQNTDLPSEVSELKKFSFPVGESQCFRFGVVGQYNHHGLSTEARRGHIQRLREVLGAPVKPSSCGGPYRVVVTYRSGKSSRTQGSRTLVNVEEVVESIRHFSAVLKQSSSGKLETLRPFSSNTSSGIVGGAEDATVRAVDWATLPVDEQARIASQADVLIGMHGAGNTWLALQPPRSVFIEIWPDYLARNVYVGLAQQYNIRYYALSHGQKGANFMHSGVTVDLEKLRAVLADAYRYLQVTRC